MMTEALNDDPNAIYSSLELAALLLGGSDDQALLDTVLDGVLSLTGAGRIYLFVEPPEKGQPKLATVREAAGDSTSTPPTNGPPPEVEQVMSSGQARLTPPTITIPLMCAGRCLGLLYATEIRSNLDETALPTLQALANQAAAALERSSLISALSSAEKAQREFVSLTTHQLRVPLTSISGYTDLLLSGLVGTLTEKQDNFLATIRRNVDRMGQLIGDLSDVNRIQDGRFPFDLAPFDMATLIEDVAGQQMKAIDGRSHELRQDLPAGLPTAHGDRRQIERVLERLLTNAIVYTPVGGIVTVSAFERDGQVQVSVADTGVGISIEDQAQLFEPFFRSEAEAVREHVGWGLSLALAKALVEAQDGTIWCQSVAGEGCAFYFTLPLAGTVQDRPEPIANLSATS
jgi:signal transduction histidine kinase